MLINFKVNNYLSFMDSALFTMECVEDVKGHEETHLIDQHGLLKSAVIYGANASGKSNLIKAMKFMKETILNSSKESNATEEFQISPFLLNLKTANDVSTFEIEFIVENSCYRYGFSLDNSKVFEEWLYLMSKESAEDDSDELLFIREEANFNIPNNTKFYSEAKGLESKTRPNALFISVVANFNGQIALSIQNWMNEFKFLSGMDRNNLRVTSNLLKDPKYKNKVLRLIKAADIGIEDIKVEEIDIRDRLANLFADNKIPSQFKAMERTLQSVRTVYDASGKNVGVKEFDVNQFESEGTKKFISLIGPIITMLEKGGILVIDELDAKLHPYLTKAIVNMFNSYEINDGNAQLIYVTHDVTNLNKQNFRRDQVWFVEKDNVGASELYSLMDIEEDELDDLNYSHEYMLGHFGGVPNFKSWLLAWEGLENE